MIPVIIFIILMVMLIYIQSYEEFENVNLYTTRFLGLAKHARLNKFNRIDILTLKPPQPRTGESQCYTVLCPPWMPDNVVCYKCA